MKIIVDKRYGFHAICIKVKGKDSGAIGATMITMITVKTMIRIITKKNMITKTKSEIYFQIRSERKKMAGESAHSRPESSSSQADEERDLPHVSEEKDINIDINNKENR